MSERDEWDEEDFTGNENEEIPFFSVETHGGKCLVGGTVGFVLVLLIVAFYILFIISAPFLIICGIVLVVVGITTVCGERCWSFGIPLIFIGGCIIFITCAVICLLFCVSIIPLSLWMILKYLSDILIDSDEKGVELVVLEKKRNREEPTVFRRSNKAKKKKKKNISLSENSNRNENRVDEIDSQNNSGSEKENIEKDT